MVAPVTEEAPVTFKAPVKVVSPVTFKAPAKVLAPDTPKVPDVPIFPITLKAPAKLKSPAISKVPAVAIFPDADNTVNLFVLIAKSDDTATFPVPFGLNLMSPFAPLTIVISPEIALPVLIVMSWLPLDSIFPTPLPSPTSIPSPSVFTATVLSIQPKVPLPSVFNI